VEVFPTRVYPHPADATRASAARTLTGVFIPFPEIA
jgi:hypothetical protein